MAITQERPLFENEDWRVAAEGLEHKPTGYFIERDAIGQRRGDGLWMWPLHVAEKSWCRMPAFREAFSSAAFAYGIADDGALARSFEAAQPDIVRAATPSFHHVPPLPRAPAPRLSPRQAPVPRRIRRAGTTLVELLRLAWNKK